MDPAEVRGSLEGIADGLDWLLIVGDGFEPTSLAGIHRLIGAIRPRGLGTMLATDGRAPDALDDLVGAGYVDRAALVLDDLPDKEQVRSMRVLAEAGAGFDVCVVLDRDSVDVVPEIADSCPGHENLVMMLPRDPAARPNKRDMGLLREALKGRARNPRVVDLGTCRGPDRPPGSGAWCSR